MKFGQEYRAALLREDYPEHWEKSIISYKQLKKCINHFQQELATIGLDPETIALLAGGPIRYICIGCIYISLKLQPGSTYTWSGSTSNFKPKLIFVIADSAKSPPNASLEQEAKAYLKALAPRLKLLSDEDQPQSHDRLRLTDNSIISVTSLAAQEGNSLSQRIETPLEFDSTFFRLLSNDILCLNALRAKEESALKQDVNSIGQDISRLIVHSAVSDKMLSKTDLYTWREAFSLYLDCQIFFSILEQEKHDRTSYAAQERLRDFFAKLEERGLPHKFMKSESKVALQGFMRMNISLLQNLKFQELNATAARKILKKFEKRTALRNVEGLSKYVSTEAFSSSSMAKAICFEISEKLLAVIPQLNDYECPVCSNISYKPIRLQCSHVFCIRCMIILQRANNDHCPLCRGSVVMQADERNLDPSLMNFLKMYFPTEVKAKQKENERYLAIDQFGADNRKCEIM